MNIKEFIKRNDTQNQFEVLKNSFSQVEKAWSNKINLGNIEGAKINSVLIAGLGGSAIGGDLLLNLFESELKIPVTVIRNYFLPTYINESTLVIAVSYSGDTEETISALKQSINSNCKIICISSGGKIEKISREKNLNYISIPPGFQPRYALWIIFFTLLKIFHLLNLIPDLDNFVLKITDLLKRKAAEYSANNNRAAALAEMILGYIPVIYSAAGYSTALGIRFKTQINENSKMHAFQNNIPAMNHNEIIGWETHTSSRAEFIVINLLDDSYSDRIKKRFLITSELISQSGTQIINLESDEKEFRIRMIDLLYLCDWISYYLGVLGNYEPSSIENIKYLKKNLAEN